MLRMWDLILVMIDLDGVVGLILIFGQPFKGRKGISVMFLFIVCDVICVVCQVIVVLLMCVYLCLFVCVSVCLSVCLLLSFP